MMTEPTRMIDNDEPRSFGSFELHFAVQEKIAEKIEKNFEELGERMHLGQKPRENLPWEVFLTTQV